jgi:hypothetical protein
MVQAGPMFLQGFLQIGPFPVVGLENLKIHRPEIRHRRFDMELLSDADRVLREKIVEVFQLSFPSIALICPTASSQFSASSPM